MNNINWNKVKIKHIVGIAKDLPGYPSEEDLLFYLIKESENKKNTVFTDIQLSTLLGQSIEKIRDLLSSPLLENYIKMNKVNDDKMTISIIKNPYL